MMKKYLFCILSVLAVCSVSHATLNMKIIADDTVLTLGQTTTLHVWGLADEAVTDNGLYDWGVSAVVNGTSSGSVQAISATILDYPTNEFFAVDFGISGSTLNAGGDGNVDASAAVLATASKSNAGVAYTELFNFQVQATGAGIVEYGLTNILGDLFDYSEMYDTGSGNVSFDTAGSINQISIVPEPSSLMILSGLSILGAFRRKK